MPTEIALTLIRTSWPSKLPTVSKWSHRHTFIILSCILSIPSCSITPTKNKIPMSQILKIYIYMFVHTSNKYVCGLSKKKKLFVKIRCTCRTHIKVRIARRRALRIGRSTPWWNTSRGWGPFIIAAPVRTLTPGGGFLARGQTSPWTKTILTRGGTAKLPHTS